MKRNEIGLSDKETPLCVRAHRLQSTLPEVPCVYAPLHFYAERKRAIVKRLGEFRDVWKTKSEKKLFSELSFCLLTPQSKAKACWDAVLKLNKNGVLLNGSRRQVRECLAGVRFANNKAGYVVRARKNLPGLKSILKKYARGEMDIPEVRTWLVRNVRGFGYKEAGHFLRNVGLGDGIAILDRHILKNMKLLGLIREIPACLTPKRYAAVENKLRAFSQKTGIPIAHLDLLFWSKETGEVFR